MARECYMLILQLYLFVFFDFTKTFVNKKKEIFADESDFQNIIQEIQSTIHHASPDEGINIYPEGPELKKNNKAQKKVRKRRQSYLPKVESPKNLKAYNVSEYNILKDVRLNSDEVFLVKTIEEIICTHKKFDIQNETEQFNCTRLNNTHHHEIRKQNTFTPRSRIAGFIGGSSWPESTFNCFKTHEMCLKTNSSHFSKHKSTCLCTEECKEYGICCVDYPMGDLNSLIRKKKRWTCTKTKSAIGYLAISSCPDEWTNEHVKTQCENKNYDQEDNFQMIPVTSKETFLTYRNVYCAVCNEDFNSEFWTTDLHCMNDSEKFKKLNYVMNTNNCNIGYSRPSFTYLNLTEKGTFNVFPLVPCDIGLISHCPNNWKTESEEYTTDIETKCELIYAPVSKTQGFRIVKFKNKYCAICNGIDDTHLLCPVQQSPPRKISQSSFSLLLDMDFSQGGLIVGSNERCPEMHLYDPWKKICRNVMCGRQYQYHNGQCVLKDDFDDYTSSSANNDFNNSLSDCLWVNFVKQELSFTDNGTVITLSDGSIIKPDQYEYIDNNTIRVCAPNFLDSAYVETFTNVQGYLTVVGICISLISLLIKILISVFTIDRRKLPPMIVLFLSISLFVAQSLFLFGISETKQYTLCVCIGIVMHYCFLATFFWMNVLAFDIWKTFASSESMVKARFSENRLICYCLYGWLTPMAIVILSVLSNWVVHKPFLNPRYGVAVCWISNKTALAVYFAFPLALLLLSNSAFFIITALEIRRVTKESKVALENSKNGKIQFGLYCKLAFIMGLTWLFGFVAAFARSTVLWYLFIAFNSIQGVYVLLAFTHFHVPSFLKSKKRPFKISGHSTASRSSVVSTSVTKV